MTLICRKNVSVFLLLLISNMVAVAQSPAPFLKYAGTLKKQQTVTTSKQFITGTTCKECLVTINGADVKVYNTGAFAYEAKLNVGENVFWVEARNGNKKLDDKIIFTYQPPLPKRPPAQPAITNIKIYPEGDLQLTTGDRINFEVSAFPNSLITAMGAVLHEMPSGGDSTRMGIYRGSYTILPTDSFSYKNIAVKLVAPSGDSVLKSVPINISILSPYASRVVQTKGRLAHLKFGLGDDRLGGAKIGYIDSLIPLEVTGKIGNNYRIKLAPGRTAYIEDHLVDLMPVGIALQPALTGKWMVVGDEKADYVKVSLQQRLPYQTTHQTFPAMVLVDVFGAVNNTNWIAQFQNVKEIEDVDYEQVADEVFRIKIKLKHPQHWGHSIYYEGNHLVIKVRHPPTTNDLKGLVIGIDAGHGGRNPGGVGITGSVEKNLTLEVAQQVQWLLEREGAKVIMTRNREMYFDNRERILFYRDSLPDVLMSIHLNSAADPIHAGGTSVFYRYPGFRLLSDAVHQRMLALGLKDYGINSSFNFMLNSATEYPNVLAELLFLSNPAEEALILDPAFQQRVAEALVGGLRDFVKSTME